jgi:formylmethanofuran dehydrogenase subunit B
MVGGDGVTESVVDDVTCLGCGCACDDIRVVVRDGRITDAQNACALGREWFGDGHVPSAVRVDTRDATVDTAIIAAANLLADAKRPLVYLAPGVSCETQRAAAGIADVLRARLDSITSDTAVATVIAAQERGFATATFGEIRHRADLVVYWAIDVAGRYPRFESRYAPRAVASEMASDRRVIAIDVGDATATATTADQRYGIDPASELAVLAALQALVNDSTSASLTVTPSDHSAWDIACDLATVLLSARYVALVFDAEPDDRSDRSAQRFDSLLALSHALNHSRRCAAIALRSGGNRSGADSVLTSQAGFPLAIDFTRGVPRYNAFRRVDDHDATSDVVLVVGNAALVPDVVVRSFEPSRTIVVGPQATTGPLGSAAVAVDTGVAGIHSAGIAFRSDDVPLPLRVPLPGMRDAADIVRMVAEAR